MLLGDSRQPDVRQHERGLLYGDTRSRAAAGQPARKLEIERPEILCNVLLALAHAVVVGLEQFPRNPRLIAGDEHRFDLACLLQWLDAREILDTELLGQKLLEETFSQHGEFLARARPLILRQIIAQARHHIVQRFQ